MWKWRLNSFKSTGSLSSVNKNNNNNNNNVASLEELPILLDHQRQVQNIMNGDPNDPRKFSLPNLVETAAESRRAEAASNPDHLMFLRQPSYEISDDNKYVAINNNNNNNNNTNGGNNPRWHSLEESASNSNLINCDQLSNIKRNNSNEIALDMDMDTADVKPDPSFISRDSRRVSFETRASGYQYQSQQQQQEGRSSDDASRNLSSASPEVGLFRSGLLSINKRNAKSRLIDKSPEDVEIMSGLIPKSGPISRSGLLGAKSEFDEEDDPFADEDVPDELRRSNLNALTLLQWVSLILIVAALICSLSIPALKKLDVWELKLWKWLVLVLVLICGRLVSGWGIRLIVFFIERNFLLRKKLLYFVYGVRKPVQNCWWLGLVLMAWCFLFTKNVERESKGRLLVYVTKVLVCFLLGTLLWLVKTLIVKVMASSFHVSTYFDRIQETLYNQYVIETLSGPPLIEIQRIEEEHERTAAEISRLQKAGATMPSDLREHAFPPPKSGKLQKTFTTLKTQNVSRSSSRKGPENGIGIEHLHKLNHKNISAWNMKRLMKMVRYGTLSTLDEQIMDQPSEDDSIKQIRSEHEATTAAKKLFHNVARRGSKFIFLEDLVRFMPEDEALRTMSLFEGASEKLRISKSSLKNWVLNAYRERRALALTLNDTKTAVNKLHHMVNFITGTIIAVIWLVILEIASSRIVVLFSSQLVLAAFIFGNTCKTIFESIIFLFITHPFDVGDRCEIDGVQFVVEEMNIMTTVFLRYDNMKMIFPNSTLSAKPIGNYYRSPDMGDAIDFFIHVSTPVEKVAIMKQRIISYIQSRKEHWTNDPMVIVKGLDTALNTIKMAVWVTHKMNYQDMAERWERRSILSEEMINIFKELDMPYRLLPIDINVCNLPTSTRFPSTWGAAESPVN